MKHPITLLTALLLAPLAALHAAERVPLIDVTDLYHPHQDVGDNFDILAAYGLPELDLKAVILDVTEKWRRDGQGRDAGFIPVFQLNAIFDRDVPCATTPYLAMKSVGDKMLDAPPFQQQGIELILKTLRESAKPVHIVSFGSARAIAVAYNREPELFRRKIGRIHLSTGDSSASATRYVNWNVALDPLATVRLLQSDLPIAIYPGDPGNTSGWASHGYDQHNTYYSLPDLRFISRMDPPLRRYLEYAFSRSARVDFLRATEVDGQPLEEKLLTKEHYVWETAVWICLSGRKLVKRADGTHRILPAAEVLPTDKVLPNELRPWHGNGAG